MFQGQHPVGAFLANPDVDFNRGRSHGMVDLIGKVELQVVGRNVVHVRLLHFPVRPPCPREIALKRDQPNAGLLTFDGSCDQLYRRRCPGSNSYSVSFERLNIFPASGHPVINTHSYPRNVSLPTNVNGIEDREKDYHSGVKATGPDTMLTERRMEGTQSALPKRSERK